jgi:hypothetical protein
MPHREAVETRFTPPIEDARMNYDGDIPNNIPGLRAFFERRHVEQIRQRMLRKHREVCGK